MKISCQSCQAKYTIADEKVLGKIVKIRCKKCGATIVINGNESGASAGGAGAASGGEAAAYDYGAGAGGDSWTVNVADGDQRTMTLDELVGAFRTGTINEETYCWKDGMGDWLPIREIAELHAATANGASPDATQQEQPAHDGGFGAMAPSHDHEEATAANANYGGAFGAPVSTNGNGAAALFGASASPAPAPAAARRQGGRGGGGMDLFGNVTHAGGEDDVMTSAPAGMPQASDEPGKLTGQRNENSVLFSLNALTQSAPKEEAPQGPGEGSGLIDIRALSASMGDKTGDKRNHVDDIMNLGGGGAFSAALAAPVLAPPNMDTGSLDMNGQPRKDNTKMIVAAIIGAGALVAIVLLLVLVLRKPAEVAPAPVAMATDTATAAAPAPTAAAAATDSTATAAAPAAPAPGGAAAPGTGQAANAAAPSGENGAKHVAAVTKHHDDSSGGSAPAPKPFVPPASGGGGGGGGGGSLDDQIRKSMGGSAPAPIANSAPASTAPFDRGAASAALSSVSVGGCKKSDGPTGSGHVKITFAPSGAVSSAVVDQPPFAGTGVGGCVAGKFRNAHIPAFAGSSVTVGKSFIVE